MTVVEQLAAGLALLEQFSRSAGLAEGLAE
jgi:hypothetical protein